MSIIQNAQLRSGVNRLLHSVWSATALLVTSMCLGNHAQAIDQWLLIDNFEQLSPLTNWILSDTQNDTRPKLKTPQVTEIFVEGKNRYLLKKPAPDGIIGNRKALSYTRLPRPVPVGHTYTFYTRINIEYFPNNHVFGLTNLSPTDIDKQGYNAFEPTIRVTDKRESDGYKNDGTLMIRQGKGYKKIQNPKTGKSASALAASTWYELWYVVNNSKRAEGGQRYDLYVRGSHEFPTRTKVFSNADFRMQREKPLLYFLANCNTGPQKQPYGNGGLRYDDIYTAKGIQLVSPLNL